MNKRNLFFAVAACMAVHVHAYDPPTMGWSSWNSFRVNISESIIKKQAQAMADLGLREKGYKYINIDDGYFGGRDAQTGQLLFHATRFPNGLKPVVDFIHGLGFKAGIYSDAGRNTCGNFWDSDQAGQGVGLYGHDEQDCKFFFNDLGFDFIKVDFCGGDANQNHEHLALNERERYTAIYNAIKATGRTDVRLNVCRWAFPGVWVHDVASSWRIDSDISDKWGAITRIIDKNMFLSAYAFGGKFNDMDMLEVGRGMSAEEDKTHFGMWCIMSSPLLIGKDMTTINEATLALLKNEELIALNQDPLALQAQPVYTSGGAFVLAKDVERLHGLKRAVAVYNPTNGEVNVKLNFAALLLDGKISLRDVYARQDVATVPASEGYTVTVPAHGTRIYVMTGEKRVAQVRYEAENAWLEQYSAIDGGDRARVMTDNTASLGARVGYLGGTIENNFMEWRDVYCLEGGYKTMTIAYRSGEDRKIECSINGESVELGTFNSGGWSTWATKTVIVKLRQGTNVIRMGNANGFAPDVDYIDIDKASETEYIIQPTSVTETLEEGKQYMIYSAATNDITKEGDRNGILYVVGNQLYRTVTSKPAVETPMSLESNALFTLEGNMTEGFKVKAATGQYVAGKNLNGTGVKWMMTDGPTYKASFPVGSWAVYSPEISGSNYWNGNGNNGSANNAFAMWSNGHPFQFYLFEEREKYTFDNTDYRNLTEVLNHAGEVGYPSTEVAQAALQGAESQEAIRAAFENLNGQHQVVMPSAGEAYLIKPRFGLSNFTYLEQQQAGLVNVVEQPTDYTGVWVCESSTGGYRFKNAQTGQYLNWLGTTVSTGDWSMLAENRVRIGALPLMMNSQWMSTTKAGKFDAQTMKMMNDQQTTDYQLEVVQKVKASATYQQVLSLRPVRVPQGVEAVMVTYDEQADAIKLIPVADGVVPTQTPFFVKTSQPTDVYFLTTDKSGVASEQGMMVSETELSVTARPAYFVYQSDGTNGAGFYRLPEGGVLPQGSAYLLIPSAKSDFYPIEVTDGIEKLDIQQTDGNAYDLGGKKVGKHYRGVVVKHGKKYIKQ